MRILAPALLGAMLSLAGQASADEQKMMAFNVSPQIQNSIHSISKKNDVEVSVADGLDDLGLLLYVLNSPSDLMFLPSIFDFHDRSGFLEGPATWSNTRVKGPDGAISNFVLMVAIRSLAPKDWSDETFDCGVARGAAASLIARADDTKLSISDVAKLSAELSC